MISGSLAARRSSDNRVSCSDNPSSVSAVRRRATLADGDSGDCDCDGGDCDWDCDEAASGIRYGTVDPMSVDEGVELGMSAMLALAAWAATASVSIQGLVTDDKSECEVEVEWNARWIPTRAARVA